MKRLLSVILLLMVWSIQAEVFSLWPVRKGGNGGSAANILTGAFKQKLHKEKIVVNGLRLDLEVSQADIPFDILLSQLKKSLGQDDFTVQGSTIRIGYPISRSREERWLLVRNNDRKTTLFHLISPVELPAPEGWPQELPPLPAGAETVQTLALPERGGILGSFRNASGDRHMILRQMSRHLESNGWIAVGAESALSRESGGDIFIRTRSGREILWIAAGNDGSGSCYYRKSR